MDDKIKNKIKLLVCGIPYGNFNEKARVLLPNICTDVEKIVYKNLNEQEYLDTIAYFYLVLAEFNRDDELETIFGESTLEVLQIIKQVSL